MGAFLTRYLADNESANKFQRYIFLDLGANIGYFSLLASDIFNKVISIEASPSIFQRLTNNIDRNNIKNISALNIAVGDKVGKANFYFDEGQSGGSSLLEGGNRKLEAQVDVSPLFDIVQQDILKSIRFIKIDVEGFEHIVMNQIYHHLNELHDYLEIMVEYGPAREGNLWEIIERFMNKGFIVHLMQGPYDINEYIEKSESSDLEILTSKPEFFCDLLLVKRDAFL